MTQMNPDPIPPAPTPTPAGGAPPGVSPIGLGGAAPGLPYAGPAPDQDSRTMGMLAHLLGIITGWLGPLIIWLIKKDSSPFVNDQGKEALNWEITLFIGYVALWILQLVLAILHVPVVGCLVSLLFVGLWIMNLIFCIQGGMTANKGVAYRYPFSLRLIK